jgi:hypothetical protein
MTRRGPVANYHKHDLTAAKHGVPDVVCGDVRIRFEETKGGFVLPGGKVVNYYEAEKIIKRLANAVEAFKNKNKSPEGLN